MKRLILNLFFIVCSVSVFAQSPELFQYQAVVRDAAGAVIPNSAVGVQITILQGSVSGTSVYQELFAQTTNGFGLINVAVGSGTVQSGSFSGIDWANGPYYLNVAIDASGSSVYTDMGTVQLLSVPYALYAKSAGNIFSGNYNDLTNKPVLAGDVNGQIESNTVTGIQGMDISTNLPANGQVLKWNNISQTWEPSDDQLGAAGTTDGVVTGANFTGTSTKTLTLIRSNGLGDITATFSDEVDDADADPLNEIQSLSIIGNDLSISAGNTVALPVSSYTAGTGISVLSNEITNLAPDQIVGLTGTGATTITGTYPNFTISSTDNVNDADANPANEIQSLSISGNDLTISSGNTVTLPQNVYTPGAGIGISGNVISNNSPDQTVTMANGTGISVTGSYPDFTVANTLPDQTIVIQGAGATSVTGTYPSFVVSSTDNNTTYSAGTGISLSGTTINNTAPDQTVTLTGAGATVVSGTYPSYTISSSDNNTTYTAGNGLTLTGTSFSANNSTAMWNSNLLQGIGVSTIAPVNGQILKYDGTNWVASSDANTTYSAGTGLTLTGTSFSHATHTGDVTGTTALTVTGIQGRQVSSSAPGDNQILKWSTTNNRWELGEDQLGAAGTNDGVVTSASVTGTTTKTLTLTRSQSLSDITATFTDEGSVYTAGSGINITGNTVSNTAPDQTVAITGSGATSVTGTYPNFNVSSVNTTYSAGTGMTLTGTTFNAQTANALWNANQIQTVGIDATSPTNGQVLKFNGTNWSPDADNNTSYIAGTGINITGTTVTNTSPDQTVTIAGSGSTSVSGSYPNFTVSSTDNNTTYSAGTGLTLSGTTFNSNWTTSAANIYNNNTGFVGIGNSSPQNPLHIYTAGGASNAKIGYSSAYPDNKLYFGDGTYVWVGEDAADDRLGLRGGTMSLYLTNGGGYGASGQVLKSNGTIASWQNETISTVGTGLSLTGNTINSVWSVNGTHIYNNNTGNVGVGLNAPNARLTVKGNSASTGAEPLFEIKNRAGQTVFIVYEDSVRIYIDDDPAKTNKGAFAVSGRNTAKAFTHDFLIVKPEFSRVFTGDPLLGFGVENINGTSNESYMRLTPENYFIGHMSGLNTVPGAGDFGRYNIFLGYHTGYTNSNGHSNIFMGYRAGYTNNGVQNVFIGRESGFSNNTGNTNVFIGTNSGRTNNNGIANVFIGDEAGYANVDGTQGIYLGKWAGRNSNSSGNMFIGTGAGYATSGTSNVFIGNSVGYSNTTGQNNLFVGHNAGLNTRTGSSNVILGVDAGKGTFNNSYSSNVFIGYQTGFAATTAAGNVLIGHQSGQSLTSGGGNVFIGNQSGGALNTTERLIIENSTNVSTPLVYGDFANERISFHRASNTYPMQIGTTTANGNGAYLTGGGVWTAGSSRAFKDRFVTLDGKDILEKIEQMELKGWYYKETQEYHIGPFAEDFYQAFGTGDLDIKEDLGRYLSPTDVAGVSIVAVQELIREMKELKKNNTELREIVNEQQKEIDKLKN